MLTSKMPPIKELQRYIWYCFSTFSHSFLRASAEPFFFIRSIIHFSPDKVQRHPLSKVMELLCKNHSLSDLILIPSFCYSLGFQSRLMGWTLTADRIWCWKLLKEEEVGLGEEPSTFSIPFPSVVFRPCSVWSAGSGSAQQLVAEHTGPHR